VLSDEFAVRRLSRPTTGGDGSDWISGGADADQLFGGEGSDVLDGGAGDDRLIGGGRGVPRRQRHGCDNDSLDGAVGDDTLDGGRGRDLIDPSADVNDVTADPNRDTIVEGVGPIRLTRIRKSDARCDERGNGRGRIRSARQGTRFDPVVSPRRPHDEEPEGDRPARADALPSADDTGVVRSHTASHETADLSLNITASAASVPSRQQLGYTAPVTNAGPKRARKVTFFQTLAPDVAVLSVRARDAQSRNVECPVSSGNDVTCEYGAMPAGGNAEAAIELAVDNQGGTLDFSGLVHGNMEDPDLTSNVASGSTTVTPALEGVTISPSWEKPDAAAGGQRRCAGGGDELRRDSRRRVRRPDARDHGSAGAARGARQWRDRGGHHCGPGAVPSGRSENCDRDDHGRRCRPDVLVRRVTHNGNRRGIVAGTRLTFTAGLSPRNASPASDRYSWWFAELLSVSGGKRHHGPWQPALGMVSSSTFTTTVDRSGQYLVTLAACGSPSGAVTVDVTQRVSSVQWVSYRSPLLSNDHPKPVAILRSRLWSPPRILHPYPNERLTVSHPR